MYLGHWSVSDLPAIEFDGQYRVLACLPSKEFYGFGNFGDKFPILAEPQWQEIDLQHYGLSIWDQGSTSSCFPAGTPIALGDGSERNIEEIGIGNKVITHLGNSKKVIKTFKRQYTGLMFDIEVKGYSYSLRVTDEHPLATVDESGNLVWKKAEDFEVGDFVLLSSKIELDDASCELHKLGILCKVCKLSTFYGKDVDVYNFEVEDDNSYVANNFVVHNCCGQAAAAAMQMAWVQSGRELREFSPYFVYGMINGGRDQGAMISDALNALKQVGVCLKNDIPRGSMFKYQFPQSAYVSAKNYRIFDAFQCFTFEEMCSAIALGFPVVLGILVGSNFPRLDSEGVAPLPNGGGGGHALMGMGLKKSARYGWLVKVMNSWSERFGVRGHCYLHRDHFKYFRIDSFAIQVVTDTVDDPSDPPVAHN